MKAAAGHSAARRLPLDGLRGISALLVVGQHLAERLIAVFPASQEQFAPFLFLHVVNIGFAGVVAFFSISGFVVPYSLGFNRPIWAFVISRAFRMYPTFWASLAIALAVIPLTTGKQFTLIQALANATMVAPLIKQPLVLGVYWTLPIEVGFYCLAAVASTAGVIRSTIYLTQAILVLLTLGLGLGVLGRLSYHHYPSGYFLLMAVMHFGTLSRRNCDSPDKKSRQSVHFCGWAIIISAAPIIFLTFSDTIRRTSYISELTGFYLGFTLFLICLDRSLFASRPLVFFGSISYSLYLFHPLVIELFRAAMVKWNMAATAAIPLAFTATVAVGWLVFRLIEKPAMKGARAIGPFVGLSQRASVEARIE